MAECGESSLSAPFVPTPSTSICAQNEFRWFSWHGCGVIFTTFLLLASIVGVGLYVITHREYDPLPPLPTPTPQYSDCPYNESVPFSIHTRPEPVFVTALEDMRISLCWQLTENATLYEVESTDWWTNTSFASIANTTRPCLNITDFLPATEYTIRLRAEHDSGVDIERSPYSVPATLRSLNRGYCGNSADMLVYRATKQTMKPDIQSCLVACILSGEECAVKCIHNRVGLSMDCAACWGAEGQCTLQKCGWPCVKDPKGSECAQCSKDKCFPDCVTCSGVPQWAFPP